MVPPPTKTEGTDALDQFKASIEDELLHNMVIEAVSKMDRKRKIDFLNDCNAWPEENTQDALRKCLFNNSGVPGARSALASRQTGRTLTTPINLTTEPHYQLDKAGAPASLTPSPKAEDKTTGVDKTPKSPPPGQPLAMSDCRYEATLADQFTARYGNRVGGVLKATNVIEHKDAAAHLKCLGLEQACIRAYPSPHKPQELSEEQAVALAVELLIGQINDIGYTKIASAPGGVPGALTVADNQGATGVRAGVTARALFANCINVDHTLGKTPMKDCVALIGLTLHKGTKSYPVRFLCRGGMLFPSVQGTPRIMGDVHQKNAWEAQLAEARGEDNPPNSSKCRGTLTSALLRTGDSYPAEKVTQDYVHWLWQSTH